MFGEDDGPVAGEDDGQVPSAEDDTQRTDMSMMTLERTMEKQSFQFLTFVHPSLYLEHILIAVVVAICRNKSTKERKVERSVNCWFQMKRRGR